MFGLSTVKLVLIGLAALAIVSAIGGTIFAAKSYLDGLNKQITKQQEQIAGLTIDNKKLELSNKSLSDEADRRAEEAKKAQQEAERLRKVDTESRQRLNEIETKLRDVVEKKRQEVVRDQKATLYLRLVNENVKCMTENFERLGIEGKCIRGKFVKNGERLVPKIEEPKK